MKAGTGRWGAEHGVETELVEFCRKGVPHQAVQKCGRKSRLTKGC